MFELMAVWDWLPARAATVKAQVPGRVRFASGEGAGTGPDALRVR